MIKDVGAETLAACFLAVYASHPPVTRREATLATGLPARALTGPDFHRLDFFEWFHRLISDPPLPRFSQRDALNFLARIIADRINGDPPFSVAFATCVSMIAAVGSTSRPQAPRDF